MDDKFAWMMDWCRKNKLHPGGEAWHRAELAWNEYSAKNQKDEQK